MCTLADFSVLKGAWLLPASWVACRRLRAGMPLGVGQGSRSTPAVRPYRRQQPATTTK